MKRKSDHRFSLSFATIYLNPNVVTTIITMKLNVQWPGILKLLFALITFIIRKEVVDIIVCTKIKKKKPFRYTCSSLPPAHGLN